MGYFRDQRQRIDEDWAKPENEILSPWRVGRYVVAVACTAIALISSLVDGRYVGAAVAGFFLVWFCDSLRRALRARKIHQARAADGSV